MNLNSYAPREIDGQMHVWYQAVGWQPAKPASEIQVGDRLIYNYGYTASVLSIIKKTAKTIVFEIRSKSSGEIHQQRIRKSTYWGDCVMIALTLHSQSPPEDKIDFRFHPPNTLIIEVISPIDDTGVILNAKDAEQIIKYLATALQEAE